jgi:hypothetical protein
VATAFQPNAFQTGAFQIEGGASFGDGALSATGTGTATFVGESTAAAPFSVTGTGTASFVGASTAVAPFSMTGTGTATFVGAATASSSLAAAATGIGLFTGASLAGGALSAFGIGAKEADSVFQGSVFQNNVFQGPYGIGVFAGDYDAFNCGLLLNDGSYILQNDGTSVFLLNDDSCLTPPDAASTFVDGGLSASAAAAAAFVGQATYNCGLLLNDDSSFILLNDGFVVLINDASCTLPPDASADADGSLSASGSAAAAFVGSSLGDGVLSANGSGVASFVGASDAAYNCGLLLNDDVSFLLLNDDASVILLNDSTCLVPPDGTPDAVTPPVTLTDGGGVAAPGAWRVRKKKKKKDELDGLIAQLKEQIVPYREAQEVSAQIMLRAELEHALTISLEGTLNEIESEIAALKEVLAEMDDEEALLLLM